MDEYKVIITNDAMTDIEKIHRYITVDLGNSFGADNTITKIFSAIKKLNFAPERGRRVALDVLGLPTRLITVNNYSVVFSIENRDSIVYIRAVEFGRRNII